MDENQRVLVIGATQGTGHMVVNLLLRDGHQVRALARNEAKAKEKLSSPVEIVVGDITKLNTLPNAMRDVDHIIFTATSDYFKITFPLNQSAGYGETRCHHLSWIV